MSDLSETGDEGLLAIDRLVPHVSTIPSIAGQRVRLFVREKVADAPGRAASVALMIYGGYSPAVLAFDVPHRDYSWMAFLARAGVDVFAMDMSGYGRSVRPPAMDDPANLAPEQQALAGLRDARAPSHPYELVTVDSEADDIDCVVEFVRRLRGVDKVTLVGWSGGGHRAGTYALRHPDKVERLVIFASSNYRREGLSAPPPLPKPGAAVSLQTREIGEGRRWLGAATRRDMIEPDMPGVIWNLSLTLDPLGATWGTGGLRAPTRTYWGWNARGAAALAMPALIMVGEQDALMDANRRLFEDLGTREKVFLSIADGTHFMGWEKQARVLHRASRAWIMDGAFEGRTQGRFRADGAGRVTEE